MRNLSLTSLAAALNGKEIELIVEGSDEREAVNKMITEIAAGLGEE